MARLAGWISSQKACEHLNSLLPPSHYSSLDFMGIEAKGSPMLPSALQCPGEPHAHVCLADMPRPKHISDSTRTFKAPMVRAGESSS